MEYKAAGELYCACTTRVPFPIGWVEDLCLELPVICSYSLGWVFFSCLCKEGAGADCLLPIYDGLFEEVGSTENKQNQALNNHKKREVFQITKTNFPVDQNKD